MFKSLLSFSLFLSFVFGNSRSIQRLQPSRASVVLQSSQLRTVVARRLKEKPGLNKLSNT